MDEEYEDQGSEEDDDRMDEDDKPVTTKKGASKKTGKAPKATARESSQDTKIAAAQFSINIIDLFNPPMEIHFGKWNSRALVETEWKRLKEAMTLQGIKACSAENMMPLMINMDFIPIYV